MRKWKTGEGISIKTLCGEIEIERDYYYCRYCGCGWHPVDERLSIEQMEHKITDRLRVEVAYYGQSQSSFDAAESMIEKAYGMTINEETIREVTESIGRAIYEAEAEKARAIMENMERIEIIEESKKQNRTLFILTDGAAVNTRVEDEDGSTWRENKTVMVFTDKDMIKRKDGSQIIVRKEYAALIGSADEFKGHVLNAAVRAGYGKVKNVVIIADGATWIRNMCEEIFPDATQILDLYHMKENIYTYAKEMYNQDEERYVPWAENVCRLVENGKIDEALKEIPDDDGQRPKTVKLRSYLENNREKMDYPSYKQKGWFVGSGAIESANKTIVQRRLKQAGMRWSVSGAQAMLTLRCKDESRLWDTEVLLRFSA